jgi:hypothetical protein
MTYRKIVVVQFLFLSGVGVGSLLAAEGWYNIDESPVVLDTALSTASLLLLLFLLVNLGGLMLDLTGTSERTVHLTYVKKPT